MNKICITYVPFPTEDVAVVIIKQLLDQHLIACGNVISSKSNYIWDNTFQKEDEYIAIMKTSLKCATKVVDWVEKHHPYSLPAIIQWEAIANERYVDWVETETAIRHQ